MAAILNVDDVFEMAVRTEENGAAFYRRAAELDPDSGEANFLLALAETEDDHVRTFTDMRAKLTDSEKCGTAYDPEGEAAQYIDAMANGSGGEGSPQAADSLTGQESLEDILKIAIDLEKNSVLFYLGLLDLVQEGHGREKVGDIIREEKNHVAVLARALKKIGA